MKNEHLKMSITWNILFTYLMYIGAFSDKKREKITYVRDAIFTTTFTVTRLILNCEIS